MVTTEVRRLTEIILVLAAIAVLSAFVIALGEPNGPDNLNVVQSSRFTDPGFQTIDAQAGNVTQINITATTPTKAWQGYYGNISGVITLENSGGDVFYDWIANEPEGEIYASNSSTITWTNIKCFDYGNPALNGGINLTSEEAKYGIDRDDVDGIDETYNLSVHPEFFVGTVQIATDTCNVAHPYVSSTYQATDFFNVLLADPDGGNIVFTTIIENRDPLNDTDIACFNGATCDFQLFVAEDEHTLGAAGPTAYYFWVEIE